MLKRIERKILESAFKSLYTIDSIEAYSKAKSIVYALFEEGDIGAVNVGHYPEEDNRHIANKILKCHY